MIQNDSSNYNAPDKKTSSFQLNLTVTVYYITYYICYIYYILLLYYIFIYILCKHIFINLYIYTHSDYKNNANYRKFGKFMLRGKKCSLNPDNY